MLTRWTCQTESPASSSGPAQACLSPFPLSPFSPAAAFPHLAFSFSLLFCLFSHKWEPDRARSCPPQLLAEETGDHQSKGCGHGRNQVCLALTPAGFELGTAVSGARHGIPFQTCPGVRSRGCTAESHEVSKDVKVQKETTGGRVGRRRHTCVAWHFAHEGTQGKPLQECSCGPSRMPRFVQLYQVPLSGASLAAGIFILSE